MGKTILIMDDGKVVDAIEEEKWNELHFEDGQLIKGKAVNHSVSEDGTERGFVIMEDATNTGESTANAETTTKVTENGDKSVGSADASIESGGASAEKYTGPVFSGVAQDSNRTWKTSPPPKAGSKNVMKILAVVLVILVGFGAGFGGGMAANYFSGGSQGGFVGDKISIKPSDDIYITEAVAAKVIPSVVGITATQKVISDFFFYQTENENKGVGTGLIIDENGYILTNAHVVLNGQAEKLQVLLADGREVDGALLWYDSSLDLAILKINEGNLTAAELGDSDDIKIGAYAVAVGNPLGLNFNSSVTQGVVSGLDRTVVVSDGTNNRITMEDLIQVDAAINSGNSGGPLVNSKGQVIGINSAKAAAGEGMGFAIPINTAKPIVERVKETGSFDRVVMGIVIRDVENYLEEYPQADLGIKKGALVVSVSEGSPAQAAGIKMMDIITAIDGKELETKSELIKVLLNYKDGDTVKVSLFRDGKPMEVSVTLRSSGTLS